MREFFRKIINNIKLLSCPVLINAYVFHKNGRVVNTNWGDDINYFFLKEVCQSSILMYDQLSLAFRLKLKNYLVIGSTIDLLCKENTEVWGAGIIDGSTQLKIKPSKVHAVRGPLTRQVLLQQGVECPEIYGDPALLVSQYYQPKSIKKYKYGFIGHVSNLSLVKNIVLDGQLLSSRDDVLLINLSEYTNWKDIPDQICACENILSSSLHGLIIAESYNIPNVWLEFGQQLIGGHFKFHDFFLSIGRDREYPLCICDNTLSTELISLFLNKWEPGFVDLNELLNSCPFKLSL